MSCPGLPEEVLTNCWWAFSILVSCPIPHPHLPTLELPSPPSLWQPVLSLSQGLWQKQTRKALCKASFLPEGRVRQDAEEESRLGSPEIQAKYCLCRTSHGLGIILLLLLSLCLSISQRNLWTIHPKGSSHPVKTADNTCRVPRPLSASWFKKKKRYLIIIKN